MQGIVKNGFGGVELASGIEQLGALAGKEKGEPGSRRRLWAGDNFGGGNFGGGGPGSKGA